MKSRKNKKCEGKSQGIFFFFFKEESIEFEKLSNLCRERKFTFYNWEILWCFWQHTQKLIVYSTFFFLFDKAFLFFVVSSNTWSLLNCFMLSRTNRWLNWICLIETMLNSNRDLTSKRPEPSFQFHHRFRLWEDYLVVPHLGSPSFKWRFMLCL